MSNQDTANPANLTTIDMIAVSVTFGTVTIDGDTKNVAAVAFTGGFDFPIEIENKPATTASSFSQSKVFLQREVPHLLEDSM